MTRKVFLLEIVVPEKVSDYILRRDIETCLAKLSQKKFNLGKVQAWIRELRGSERLAVELAQAIREEAIQEAESRADQSIGSHEERYRHEHE